MARRATPPAPYKPQAFDIVVVEWEDACAHASMQVSSPEEASASYTPAIRRTVGYFVSQTKDVLILASDDDRVLQGTGTPSEACGGLMFTPRAMVRNITKVASTELKTPKAK